MTRLPTLFRLSTAITLLSLSAACTTVGPDYRIPDQALILNPAASGQFIGSKEAMFVQQPLPAQWWHLYQSATLDQLIALAFAANTDLRVAAANLSRIHALQDRAEEATRPVVGVSAEPVFGKPSAVALGINQPIPNSWMYDAGIKVSYQIDLFGKIARSIEASSADTQAALAAVESVRITVAAATARAYVDICAAGQQMAVTQHSIDLQQRLVTLIAQRVNSGRGTAFDNSRAQGQLEQLRAELPGKIAQQQIAQFRLAVLIGQLPGSLPEQINHCDVLPQLASAIPVGDGAALLKRRPDIRQAERQLAAATARIGVATADLYPSINLGLSAGSTGEMLQFGAADAARLSVGPLISWTFPAFGPARNQIKFAEAGSVAALAHFDGTVLTALRETESALTMYARELDRHSALQSARDQAALASKQAATLFHAGRTDYLTTLDAERTLAVQENTLAISSAQIATDQIALFLSLGGGWE